MPGFEPVTIVDAADIDAVTRANADGGALRFVLIGASADSSGALARTLACTPRPITLRLERPSFDDMDEREAAAGLALRRAAQNCQAFASPIDAAERAAAAAAAWLEEQAPSAEGERITLADWERRYLSQRLPGWRRGKPGPLVGLGGPQELTLAAMYVPTPATTDQVFQDDEGKVVFHSSGSSTSKYGLLAKRYAERFARNNSSMSKYALRPLLL